MEAEEEPPDLAEMLVMIVNGVAFADSGYRESLRPTWDEIARDVSVQRAAGFSIEIPS